MAVGIEAERTLIENYFDTEWLSGSYYHVPVAYPNVDFEPPHNKDSYVRLQFLATPSNQITLGGAANSSLIRFQGILQIDIYVEEGIGSKEARAIMDECSRILTRTQISSVTAGVVTFRTPEVVHLGLDGEYDRYVISWDYERDVFD